MLLLCGPAMASDVLPPPLIGNPAEEQVQQEPPRDAEGETQSPEETPAGLWGDCVFAVVWADRRIR